MARTAAVLTVLLGATACAPREPEPARFVSREISDKGLLQLASGMDPAMRALALRHDPGSRAPDRWGRTSGWERLDLDDVPDLGLGPAEGQTAEEVNALRPFATLPIRPMRPFVLKASGADRARAVQCLAEAVYYEAAREPEVGQEAVAQVVLNRLRHPAYPKSVCGVVYQGSARATGCQFTFTCDGSLRYKPMPALWSRARAVAERALNGYVETSVGSATHYHAQYVAPYWAPTLVKMKQVGQHIFYRWTGPWGEPPAFTGRYAGGEAYLSPAVLGAIDARTQGGDFPVQTEAQLAERKITLAVAGEVRTYSVVDPTVPGGERQRVMGVLMSTRRQPTPDEVRRINQTLETLERDLDAKAAASAPVQRATD
ncbi:MAG: cell wall hydrolase [Phenylobacterium sp.]|uniref:cell wall hydrolase n=1 Tax=Phenylobacterium sp. TaxID=1871053 RepID=UPI001A55E420|nr:cell wall hydrolase [Phenylobacterium sp.]MBL8773213.1 cell wall hydrolase [Phenylobacterium sp.]